jgi:hypothetical protein
MSAAAATDVGVEVSTKLLENYRSVTPALSEKSLAVAAAAYGPVIAGISSTNRGYVLLPDTTSPSGWSTVSLGTSLLKGPITVVTDSAGVAHVFATDGLSLLHARKNGSRATDWTTLEPVSPTTKADCWAIATLNHGNKTHVVVSMPGAGAMAYGVDSTEAPGVFQWFPAMNPAWPPGPDPNPSWKKTYVTTRLFPGRNGQVLVANIYSSDRGWSGTSPYALYEGSGANWSLIKTDDIVDNSPSVITADDGTIAVFTTQFQTYLAECQAAPGAPWKTTSWDLPAILVRAMRPWLDPINRRICGLFLGFGTGSDRNANPYYAEAIGKPPEQWSVTSVAEGEKGIVPEPPQENYYSVPGFGILPDPVTRWMRAFAIDTQSQLCVMEQQASGWSPFIPLGHKATVFHPINHPDGFTQVVAVEDGNLYFLSHNAATTEWTRTDIEFSLPNEAHPYNCYSTEIMVTDANGVFRPRVGAVIKASDLIDVRINGEMVLINPIKPVSVSANSLGRITIETGIPSINCPELLVHVEGMEADSWVSIVPQLEIQEKLRAATSSADELLAQKDRHGNYVVTGPIRSEPQHAKDVAEALHRCCELAASAGKHLSATAGPLFRNKAPDWVRYVPPGQTRSGGHLHLEAIMPISWSLDFTSGMPVFRNLSAAEAAEAFRDLDPEVWSLLREAWGAVFGGIKAGYSYLEKLVVEYVIDPVKGIVTEIKAKVEAVIEGAKKILATTVNLIEQVFDVIEGVFAQIKTFVKPLIDWLAFFFDWQDILRTKYAVKYLMAQWNELFDGVMEKQQSTLPARMREAADKVQGWFDQARGPIGSRNVLQLKDQNSTPQYLSGGQAHNIVQSNFFDAVSSGKAIPFLHVQLTVEAQQDLDSIAALLESLGKDILKQPSYADAHKYLASMVAKLATRPDEFLSTALTDIFAAMASLASAGLRLIGDVLEKLIGLLRKVLGLLQSVLDSELYIPVISPLYKLISGGEVLTFGDVISLAAAVAITLSYKIATGKAPFTEESLKAFKADWAAPALLAKAGIGPDVPRPSSLQASPTRDTLNLVLFIAVGVSGLCSAFADLLRDKDYTVNSGAQAISIAMVCCDLTANVLDFPWAPFLTDDPVVGDPLLFSVDGATVVSWLLDLVSTGIDIGSILKWKLGKDLTPWGPGVTTTIGIAQFVMYIAVIKYQNDQGKWNTKAQQSDLGSMLGYFPDLSKVLLYFKSDKALIAQMALDGICPAIGGLLVMMSNTSDSPLGDGGLASDTSRLASRS